MKMNLFDLNNNECRGVVSGGYCAERVLPGQSYCAEHYARTRRPTPRIPDNDKIADYLARRVRGGKVQRDRAVPVDHFMRGLK